MPSRMSALAVARPSPAYRSAVEELRDNPGQWQAYNANGHCVVLAGPGSGKTKTLTVKIAKLLIETIREPRGLACITYNAECARELVTRLERLGVYASGHVFIGTVHSFLSEERGDSLRRSIREQPSAGLPGRVDERTGISVRTGGGN